MELKMKDTRVVNSIESKEWPLACHYECAKFKFPGVRPVVNSGIQLIWFSRLSILFLGSDRCEAW